MAARVTRSASQRGSTSGAASGGDDASRCLMLAMSHDELGVIVDGLADPLQPVVAVALSSTCKGLRTPLRAALEVLKERHEKAKKLCDKVDHPRFRVRVAWLPHLAMLNWQNKDFTASDMATLAILLPWMPCLEELLLGHSFGDGCMPSLFERLERGVAPSLTKLYIQNNNIGPAGAEALAAALRRGAMPKLMRLTLANNPTLGNQGAAALGAVLRKRSVFERLDLGVCGIGDEGVASLVDNLGKDDFKALRSILLRNNNITDAGMATLAAGYRNS